MWAAHGHPTKRSGKGPDSDAGERVGSIQYVSCEYFLSRSSGILRVPGPIQRVGLCECSCAQFNGHGYTPGSSKILLNRL